MIGRVARRFLRRSGASSITVPDNVPVPFRDYLATARLDWAQSNNSHWFLRGALDTYTQHNALVQQGALPSAGATSHNNYFSVVLGAERPPGHRGDWWELNDQGTALIGTRGGGALRLGDTIAVTIGGVDAPRGRLDLLPVDKD